MTMQYVESSCAVQECRTIPHGNITAIDEGDEIILKKYHPSCIFCSDARDVVPYKGKLVCKSCLAELRNAQD